ncbi:D-arginine dehydrogenase [Pseudoduganella flava]|uniref:D-arginine dehydrogenase n=1 Tax=Pseudoduganella flava TaxID=871742 RepID=A0A562Q3I3_9BURK|nr:FAD-binding oxidoreductase [Pseudoduganella flava]QGZ41329.1 FAD-dependent oxidoreductase [Pseudoduganella flava]TWI51273.1 D-arginine dehydrogenase [Pseudoduganella flava]
MNQTADFIVIGAGIGGASVAYWLAQQARVVVLEGETQPGYHSTGRSAALFMESYGPPQVRALTRASLDFFRQPPEGFGDHALLSPRGAFVFAAHGQEAALDEHEALVRQTTSRVERLDARAALDLVPVLRPGEVVGGVLEKDAADIDVDALLQGFLRGARRHGALTVNDAAVTGLRHADGVWTVATASGSWQAPVVVNAAGAWADEVARLAGADPVGLVPKRRSAFIFAPPDGLATAHWPLFLDVHESFYIKPDAGTLLGSPCNADATFPHDVQAEELDIAIAIDNIERLTTLRIRRPTHVWAGLRSFVADGELVGGFDAKLPGFFWAAAQGGYGIQSAPGAGRYYASVLLGEPVPAAVAATGFDPACISPQRFQR